MQWLMVALLVSVVALLLAAASMVRYIRIQRKAARHRAGVESKSKVNS